MASLTSERKRVKANMEVLARKLQLLSELDWQLDAKEAERAHPSTMNEHEIVNLARATHRAQMWAALEDDRVYQQTVYCKVVEVEQSPSSYPVAFSAEEQAALDAEHNVDSFSIDLADEDDLEWEECLPESTARPVDEEAVSNSQAWLRNLHQAQRPLWEARREETRREMVKLDEKSTAVVNSLPHAPQAGPLHRQWVKKAREATAYPALLKEVIGLNEALTVGSRSSISVSSQLPDSYRGFSGLPVMLEAAGLEQEVSCTQMTAAADFESLSTKSSNPLFGDEGDTDDIVF